MSLIGISNSSSYVFELIDRSIATIQFESIFSIATTVCASHAHIISIKLLS